MSLSELQKTFAQGFAAVRTLFEFLLGEIAALRERVAQLEARLAKNSSNSAKPPSSDALAKTPVARSLRRRSGRKPGGQPGHPGHTLLQVEYPDHVVQHVLGRCPCGQCSGVDLRKQPLLDYDKRQVFHFPKVLLETTENQAERKLCPCSGQLVTAAFPAEVTAPAQYHGEVKAFAVYLNTQQMLPFDRISQLFEDLFGRRISPATITAASRTLFGKLEPFEQALKQALLGALVLHVDESGLRVAGKLHWLHTACTTHLTFYGVHASRGGEAMDEMGILAEFRQRLIHDFWNPYLGYEECLHGFCNEHLLRELKLIHEQHHQAWAGEMSALLLEFHRLSLTKPDLSEPMLDRCHDRYGEIIDNAWELYPASAPSGRPGRPKKSDAENLLQRLGDYEECILAFLHDPNVPFTNNQAEQDIRMIKVKAKISGCFRTLTGANIFARIRAYLSTMCKQQQNLLRALGDALAGTPILPAPP